MSSFILEMYPLSVLSFAIMFSHPEGSLFTLLMVFCAADIMYTYGWFLLMMGRNQHNTVKQSSSN